MCFDDADDAENGRHVPKTQVEVWKETLGVEIHIHSDGTGVNMYVVPNTYNIRFQRVPPVVRENVRVMGSATYTP